MNAVEIDRTADRGEPTDGRTVVIEKQRADELKAEFNVPVEHTAPEVKERLQCLLIERQGSDTDIQVDRVLTALQGGSVTTHELRHYLDILHPAGRVLTLRNRGCEILMTWVRQASACGKVHRVGRYTLLKTN